MTPYILLITSSNQCTSPHHCGRLSRRMRQWMEFVASSMMGFTINWSVYYLLTTYVEFFDTYRLLAMITGIICGSVFNFTASTLFVYSDKRNSGD